jgi:hypothetical protein
LLDELHIENEARLLYMILSMLSGSPVSEDTVRDIEKHQPDIVSRLRAARAEGTVAFRWTVKRRDGSQDEVNLRLQAVPPRSRRVSAARRGRRTPRKDRLERGLLAQAGLIPMPGALTQPLPSSDHVPASHVPDKLARSRFVLTPPVARITSCVAQRRIET